MEGKLAVAMSNDGCFFINGNTFEDDERVMQHSVAQLELTGRITEKQFYIEIEIPEQIVCKAAVVTTILEKQNK